MLRALTGITILTFIATVLLRGGPRPVQKQPVQSAPATTTRRRIHPDQTGAGVADRWELEGDGSLVRAAAF